MISLDDRIEELIFVLSKRTVNLNVS